MNTFAYMNEALGQYHNGLICEQELVLALQCTPAQIHELKTQVLEDAELLDWMGIEQFGREIPNSGKLSDMLEIEG